MARSKKITKRITAFVLTFFILSSFLYFPAYSETGDERLYTVDYVLIERAGFTEEELKYETIDSVNYIYVVENGCAAILNMQVQYKGPEKNVLTLPELLGGYPVTTFGYVGKEIEVFAYICNGEELKVNEYGETIYPEYTPGLDYVSKFIFPEGYEYIGDLSLRNYADGFSWQLPKSLKRIYGEPVEYFFADHKTELVIFPECMYDNAERFVYCVSNGGGLQTAILPSRDINAAEDFIDELTLYNQYLTRTIYIPANISYDAVKKALDNDTTFNIVCAPDSEWLKVFEDYPGYNIDVTYVEPATYIAFDSEDVSVAVGEVVDLEAKTYPAEAVWTACDYVSSNPEVVKVDPYSGRITALAEGTATITATHVERGFVDSCTVTVEPYVEHECEYSTEWATDENYHWHECADSDCQEISNYAEHSGGTATVNAKAVCEYCGMAYGEYAQASYSVEPVSDIAYCAYGNREYKVTVAGSPDKIQFIRYTGTTSTYVRSQAEITDNGDGTETWIVTARLNKGAYTLAAKYGRVWNKNGAEFEIVFVTPSCRSFTSEKTGNITTFTVVTDPQVAKIQFITQSGSTLTYSQGSSYIGEDGLRYWTVSRKITKPGTIGLRTKYGSIWTTTDFTVEV